MTTFVSRGVGGGVRVKENPGRQKFEMPNSYSNLIMWEITIVHNLCNNQYPSRGG